MWTSQKIPELQRVGLRSPIFDCGTSRVKGCLASLNVRTFFRLWLMLGNDADATSSRKLIGHAGPVYGVNFSPDGKYLLSCSEDRTARLWSLDTYTALVSYKGHSQPVWDAAFGPYGHYFATASHDQTARLWSCDHIYPLRIFAGHLSDVDVSEYR